VSGLTSCKLGDVVSFGNGKSRPSSEGNIPIYGGNGILGYCANNNYDGETIVIGRVGAYCGATYYENEPIWISDNALSAKPKGRNNTKFFYYFLKDMDLNQHAGGSSHPLVTQTLLNSLDVEVVKCPDEQKAIASVLSSLDDKIDLLHRQNTTLERMAETLFRQWFVEEAQEDWEVVPFVDFFDFLEGPGIRNWQYTESGTPFINIRLISNGDIDISKASYISNEEANGKYKHFHLQAGDMIVSTSGTLGKNAIVRDYHLPLMLNTSVIRFRPKDGKNYAFVYQYLNSKLFQEHLESAASGSVQANFGTVHLKQMTLPKPPSEALEKFANQADRFYEKIRINQAQIKTLEKLRDNLLPKLMSGEVRL
jgi:type I restriction enzyme S subunit